MNKLFINSIYYTQFEGIARGIEKYELCKLNKNSKYIIK